MVTLVIQQLIENVFKATVSSDLGGTPTFYWYENEFLTAVGPETERILTLSPNSTTYLQVLDTTDAPDQSFPAELFFQWNESPDARRYDVEQYLDGEWEIIRTIVSQGVELLTHITPAMIDGDEVDFRIVPYTADGIQGNPLEFSLLVVCYPTAPILDSEYDEVTQQVTIF